MPCTAQVLGRGCALRARHSSCWTNRPTKFSKAAAASPASTLPCASLPSCASAKPCLSRNARATTAWPWNLLKNARPSPACATARCSLKRSAVCLSAALAYGCNGMNGAWPVRGLNASTQSALPFQKTARSGWPVRRKPARAANASGPDRWKSSIGCASGGMLLKSIPPCWRPCPLCAAWPSAKAVFVRHWGPCPRRKKPCCVRRKT